MTDIQIKNSGIDSNNWVNMKGVTFIPGYKKHNEAVPIDGTQAAKIPEGDRIGIEPPVITIRGVINVDDFDSTAELWSETPSTLSSSSEDGVSNANAITMGYLLALWRNLSGQTKLKISFGDPGDQKTWKNWDNTSDELYVVVDDINPVPAVDSNGLHIVDYALVCREVVVDGTYTT